MGEMSCPQCGNPNLDVDSENNVVYCKRCGFAVQVNPETGDVTPLKEGGAPAAAGAPEYQGGRSILGVDPFTFFMGATALLLLAQIFAFIPSDITVVGIVVVSLLWWFNH